MPLSMYDACVPPCLQMLHSLSTVLDKAAAHAQARKIDPAALLNARLYPDMFPFVRQVQIAADFAKGSAGRLAGAELPSYPDTESSFDELKARVRTTIEFIEGLAPDSIKGSAERDVTIRMRGQDRVFQGQAYLLHFALPNLYFHVTTAYDILRHNGVELGKADFMGPMPQ